MQGEQGETGNRTIWGDSSVKWKPGQSENRGSGRGGICGITGVVRVGGTWGSDEADGDRTQASTGVSRRWSWWEWGHAGDPSGLN